jgi:hypothetical protein
MIIWGSRGQEKDVASGQFYCPHCDGHKPYIRKRVAQYFTVFFIPLFESENLGEYIECQSCHEKYKPEILNYKPPSPAQQFLLVLKQELEVGMPLHMLEKKLMASNLSEVEAKQLIENVTAGNQTTCQNCGFKYLGTIKLCSNCGNALTPTAQTLPPLSPEVSQLLKDLKGDKAKRRWSIVQTLAKMQIDDERVVAALEELAYHDPVPYVRTEAEAALQLPTYQAIVQRRRGW